MKKIYSFSIPKIVEVEETQETPEGKLVKKVKKEEAQNFFIARPNRLVLEEGELYYNQRYNEYLKAGIMPEILLRKMYGNENGIFTENEKKEYVDLYIKLGKNLSRIKELEDKKKEDFTDEDKKEIESLHKRNKEIQNNISDYENAKQSVFENSAETLSRNKTVFWWLLKILYYDNDQPVFPGETHESRALIYDTIQDKIDEESDESSFYSKLVARAGFLVSLFYINGTVKPEDFLRLVETYDRGITE